MHTALPRANYRINHFILDLSHLKPPQSNSKPDSKSYDILKISSAGINRKLKHVCYILPFLIPWQTSLVNLHILIRQAHS